MGKSKSVPDLATKSMVTWTSDDVKQWLKEHESLNKYTKQLKVQSCNETMPELCMASRNPLKPLSRFACVLSQGFKLLLTATTGNILQGTTGKELMKLTDDILSQIGIKNPLHRMQLINTRDDLLTQQQQDSPISPASQLMPAASSAPPHDAGSPTTESPSTSKTSSPSPSFVVLMHSPKVPQTWLLLASTSTPLSVCSCAESCSNLEYSCMFHCGRAIIDTLQCSFCRCCSTSIGLQRPAAIVTVTIYQSRQSELIVQLYRGRGL